MTIISTKGICSSVPPTRAAPMAWLPDIEWSLELVERIIREEINSLLSA